MISKSALPAGDPRTSPPDTTRTPHPPPLQLLSALFLALGDWLAFGLNVFTLMQAYWLVTGGCALAVAGSVATVELLRSEVTPLHAALKGCGAGAVILLLLPLAGSAAALALLGWWLASRPAHLRGAAQTT